MPADRAVAEAEKKLKEFQKLAKKGNPCTVLKAVEKYFRAPVKVALIEAGELKLKDEFEKLIEDLTEACEEGG